MNKNSKCVKHAKAVLKYWNKPFCVCLLNYIEELEDKAYKSDYYQEHADLFFEENKDLKQEIKKLKSKKYIFDAKTNEIKEIPISDGYISKDKIKAKIQEYRTEKANMTQIFCSKYGKTQQTFKQAVYNEVIKVLEGILGE